jgi:hypothetical protein
MCGICVLGISALVDMNDVCKVDEGGKQVGHSDDYCEV